MQGGKMKTKVLTPQEESKMKTKVLTPQEERILQGQGITAKRPRVSRILEALRAQPPRLSVERAWLFTESFKQTENLPLVLRWAKAIEYIMQNIGVYIGPDELIVGRCCGYPGRYSILYPELDLAYYESPSDIPAKGQQYILTEEDVRIISEELIPYWKGRTFLESVFDLLPQDTRDLFYQPDMRLSTCIIQESATVRHSLAWVLDYEKVLKKGFNGIKREAEEKIAALDPFSAENNYGKLIFYKAVITVCDATVAFAKRYAELARNMAEEQEDYQRKKELLEIAEICEWVPGNPARTFREAIQSQWFTQVVSRFEQHHGGVIGNGRIDQYLYPYYKADVERGHLTEDEALELIECLWLKIAETVELWPSPRETTFAEANPHFENTCIGGLTRDGRDATNELSYLILRSKVELPLNYPDLSVRIHSGTPEPFLMEVVECIKQGTGLPKLFNDEEIMPILLAKGGTLEEVRDWCPSGCTEPKLINRNTYFTGTSWLNLGAVLEMALNEGKLRRYGDKQLGLATGDPRGFATYEDMWNAFRLQLENCIKHCFKFYHIVDTIRPQKIAAPLSSCLHDLSMREGKDVNEGRLKGEISLGPQISIVGFGTAIDSLAAIKKLVYEDKVVTMDELLEALESNFEGKEVLRQRCLNAPKYGNCISWVDAIGRDIEEAILSLFYKYTNVYGGKPEFCSFPITAHVSHGKVVGATPNGRKAGEPLSEGISPTQGADTKGPTATLLSIAATKWTKYSQRAARLLNLKLSPQAVAGREGTQRLASFIRAWCDQKHWHIQFNVINRETLIEARKHPERYRDLLVRVAGYSAYFVDLSPDLQNEIIARTEHTSF
jgi:formate C-acetyltransferase